MIQPAFLENEAKLRCWICRCAEDVVSRTSTSLDSGLLQASSGCTSDQRCNRPSIKTGDRSKGRLRLLHGLWCTTGRVGCLTVGLSGQYDGMMCSPVSVSGTLGSFVRQLTATSSRGLYIGLTPKAKRCMHETVSPGLC